MSRSGPSTRLRRLASRTTLGLRLLFLLATVNGLIDARRPAERREVLASIERLLGARVTARQRRKIARRFFVYRRRFDLIFVWLTELEFAHARRMVAVEGLHHLDEALSAGRGAIIASTHMGYGRIIKPILRLHGRPAMLVGGLSYRLPEYFAPDISPGVNLRPFFSAMRDNKPLVILLDGRRTVSARRLSVLGIDMMFAPGAIRIARASGAAVLPTFAVDHPTLRDPLGLRLVIHPAIDLQKTNDEAADTEANLRRFADAFERELMIHAHNFRWDGFREQDRYRRLPARKPE